MATATFHTVPGVALESWPPQRPRNIWRKDAWYSRGYAMTKSRGGVLKFKKALKQLPRTLPLRLNLLHQSEVMICWYEGRWHVTDRATGETSAGVETKDLRLLLHADIFRM